MLLAVTASASISALTIAWRRQKQRDDEANSPLNQSLDVAALSHLPTLESAQLSDVLVTKKFLNQGEIDQLLSKVDTWEQRKDCGQSKRDKHGLKKYKAGEAPWRTLYLHTDHTIQKDREFGSVLLKKILDHAREKDGESCWDFLKDKDNITFRTIEYHEVVAGGGLPQKTHFDGGSLVTGT
jgi:hypothetical protein